jgi:nucleolar GTP-binding protein
MNFQSLPVVESSDGYLDSAFGSARTLESAKMKDREQTKRIHETRKIEVVRDSLTKPLRRIVKGFPAFDRLPDFYRELMKTTLDYGECKKSLAGLQWAADRIDALGNKHRRVVMSERSGQRAAESRRAFYGRVSSVMKQISPALETLKRARRTMKGYPDVLPDAFTVALAGYPNVGKSSLLASLTDAKPEIKDYAFTTKRLNFGYMKGIQIIDTPGTFDRDADEMNYIERQAYLCVTKLADMVVFVFDDTVENESQRKLLARVRKLCDDVLLVHSKADILDKRSVGESYISSKTGEGIQKLGRLIEKHEADRERENHEDRDGPIEDLGPPLVRDRADPDAS